jgi:hypothetical protein
MLVVCVAALFVIGGSATATSTPQSTRGYCAARGATFQDKQRLIGVNIPDLGTRGEADLQCTLGRVAADRLGYVVCELAWNVVEPTAGQYNFTFYDQLMTGLAEHHLRWLPVVEAAPPFATMGASPPTGAINPPDPERYADFMALLVGRYGPHGSFWRQHPSLPYVPVRAWQVWSEPNLPAYWYPKPNPAAYTNLLRDTWRSVEGRYPHTTLLGAGMPFISGINFYRQILRFGGARWFSAANLHDYSSQVRYAELYLRLLRETLDQHGAGTKPIWVTEFGWASNGPPSPFTKDARAPADVYLLFRYMIAHRRALRLDEIVYYDWRDPLQYNVDFWGNHLGLYTAADVPRPVSRVVMSTAARGNG